MNLNLLDPLGEILTEEEIKFLAEVLTEAWFSLDVRNMSYEKRKMYSSIKSKIARLNKGGSPPNALLLMSSLSLILIWATGLRELLESVGTVVILTTGIAVLGVIVLRFRKPDIRRPIKLPFFPLPPIVFLCLTLWIVWGVFSTNITSVILISVIIVAGLVVWFCYSKKHSNPI